MGRTACTDPQCLYKGSLYFSYYNVNDDDDNDDDDDDDVDNNNNNNNNKLFIFPVL
jgi:hypothetical protein